MTLHEHKRMVDVRSVGVHNRWMCITSGPRPPAEERLHEPYSTVSQPSRRAGHRNSEVSRMLRERRGMNLVLESRMR